MHPIITEELAAFEEEYFDAISKNSVTERWEERREFKLVASWFLSRVLSKLVAEVEGRVEAKPGEESGWGDKEGWDSGFNCGRSATLDALRSVIGKE